MVPVRIPADGFFAYVCIEKVYGAGDHFVMMGHRGTDDTPAWRRRDTESGPDWADNRRSPLETVRGSASKDHARKVTTA